MQVGELVAELRIDDAQFLAAIARAGQSFGALSGSAASQGQQVGASFSRGLAGGITANTGVIQAAARAAALAAKTAAERALQVHSPSRVGAGIGKNFALGMAEGIEGMAKSVGDAAALLARAAGGSAAFGPYSGAAAGAPGVSKSAPVDYELILNLAQRQQTVLQLDGRIMAQTIAADSDHALGSRARQLALGVGG